MSIPTRRASAAMRAARRWARRLAYTAWRIVRMILVASAAMAPNTPPPPPPPPPAIEMRAKDGKPPDAARGESG
jgi:hypothetical protein